MNRLSLALAASLAALTHAYADAPECTPLADVQSEISALGGGKLEPTSREKLLFARGMFVASPPLSPYPSGDEGMMALFPNGTSTFVFADRGQSCGRMMFSPQITKLLLEIDRSI